ncbi:glycosyltransferase family 4 protein [Alienimonas sp. DA493]|uniref:glycosyltransferase family 4 protein n=1 Tax=Alienimonas sp. DA493 TaxID=3373605 RepID=UPI00375461C9
MTSSVPPVLFVESYPQVLAGQQRTLLAMLDAWPADGPEPVVVAPAGGPLPDALPGVAGGRVRFELLPPRPALNRYGGAIYRDRGLAKLKTLAAAAGGVADARRFLKRLRPAAVFCNDMRGILTLGVAAKSLRIPLTTWDKLDKPHGRGGWMDRLELPLCDRVLVISEAVKTKFPPAQLRRYAAKLKTVRNGIDFAPLDAAEPDRRRFGLADDDFVVLLAGTVTHRKGVDRVLGVLPDLLDAVPHAVVAVAGAPSSDQDRAYADGLPNRDHPRVRWLGQRDDLPTLMHSCDLFCLPSRTEGMGRVLVEAMAARKPCVGSRAGGIPEVIADGETGLLFDGDDPADLLRSLTVLAHAPERRRRMGEAGRTRAETRFHGPTQIGKVTEEILDLVSPKSGLPQSW